MFYDWGDEGGGRREKERERGGGARSFNVYTTSQRSLPSTAAVFIELGGGGRGLVLLAGAMEFMQLKEATIIEVWLGSLPPSVLVPDDKSSRAGTDANDAEVAGFNLTTLTVLRAEASTPAGRTKYGPWLLDVLAHCPACFVE